MSYSSTTSYRHQRYFCTNSLKRTSVWHGERKCLFPLRIYTALKQNRIKRRTYISLFSLRIYTALKQTEYDIRDRVCFPYEFTLLSNSTDQSKSTNTVCFPYEFTLLSNPGMITFPFSRFVFPTNLHCSQTSNRPRIIFCKIPVSLHRSYHSSLY